MPWRTSIYKFSQGNFEEACKQLPGEEAGERGRSMRDDKRLGRGLAGLMGDNYDNKKDRQEYLPISLLHPSKFQPRKHFDEESLKELASSIEKMALYSPS